MKGKISKLELELLNDTDCTGGRGRVSKYRNKDVVTNSNTTVTISTAENGDVTSKTTTNNRVYNYMQLKDFLEKIWYAKIVNLLLLSTKMSS